MLRRVLLLGGSGWLGAAVARTLAARFACAAPPRSAADLGDEPSLRRVFESERPDAVVNLAAVNPGRGGAAEMERVNVAGAGLVAALARDAGARLVHMSSDAVLDGRAAPYGDAAAPCGLTPYGRTKAAGEAAVRAAHPGALLVRTSLLFDPAAPERFTRDVIAGLARGEGATLYTDEIRCPISRTALAAALAELVLRDDVSGTLNVAGTQPLSRFDYGMRLLRRFGATRLELVRAARAAELSEPRALDLTLDVSRAQSLLRTPLRGVDAELAAAPPPA